MSLRCFPIVPKLACEHLRIPSVGGAIPITLLGGLTSFGGAGNNYSMHVSPSKLAIVIVADIEDGKHRHSQR